MTENTFKVSDGEVSLAVSYCEMGNDLQVCVCGGDKPHIGSVSVSVPRKSLNSDAISSTTSTINLPGHKDNAVADALSSALSAKLNKTVVVSCGIHYDDAQPQRIESVLQLIPKILTALESRFSGI